MAEPAQWLQVLATLGVVALYIGAVLPRLAPRHALVLSWVRAVRA